MADTLEITEGSGTVIDTDEVTRNAVTCHQQVVKISLGADGASDCLVDSGQQTMANSLPVVISSDQDFIAGDKVNITTSSAIITVTPTLAVAGAYAAGDVVGAANEVAAAFTATKLSGYLTNITLIDKAKQNANLTVFLFAASPTLANADNGAFDITDANLATATPLGHVNITSGDYASTSSNSVASIDCSKLLKASTTSFYFAVMTSGTPTYTNGDLIFSFHIAQD